MTLDQALKIFGFTKTEDQETTKHKYHELAKKFHPDLGGTADQFRCLIEAYELICNSKPFIPIQVVPTAKKPDVDNRNRIFRILPERLFPNYGKLKDSWNVPIPETIAKEGGLLLAMHGRREYKLNIPPNSYTGMTAYINGVGTLTMKITPDPR